MYPELLAALEASRLGQFGRESAWGYALTNVAHVLGSAMVVGGIAVFDIKALRDPHGAAAVGSVAIPLAAWGLTLMVPTGVLLLAPEARSLGVNPAFYAKMAFLALAMVNVAIVHRRFASGFRAGVLPEAVRFHAALSLAAWVLVLAAGRMIAYI